MRQTTAQASVTSQTIAVKHIRISSGRPFAVVRGKLEGTVPKAGQALPRLGSVAQQRANDYEKTGPSFRSSASAIMAPCCRLRAADAMRCNMRLAIPSPLQR